MTLLEAINGIDTLVENSYTVSDKVRWLSELDAAVKKEILDTHEGGLDADFSGYDDDSDPNTPLLICPPYDGLYLKYLEAQIHYYNAETGRYNNAMALYNAQYADFERWYNRTHAPLSQRRKFW